jgi:hypothetical protein
VVESVSKRMFLIFRERFNFCYRRVFGNEWGKVLVESAKEKFLQGISTFTRRQAGRKAALKGVAARNAILESAYFVTI